MESVGVVLIGFVVGMLAKLLLHRKDSGGFIVTALFGVAGAFLAKSVGQHLGWFGSNEPAQFIACVSGAILLMVLYGLLFIPRQV
jgi:uncharacterized membrane protein YeaQ/YmgE (transglycosylase-associated protein family)